MIKIEKTEVYGWEAAIRGMRNPKDSWDKSDSGKCHSPGNSPDCSSGYCIGLDDYDLMMRLRNAGTDHRKFMRMITLFVDVTAPLYWWKEYDTYKVGTVANSCSTMHKIHEKEFTLDDFSIDNLGAVPNNDPVYYGAFEYVLHALNEARHCYLDTKDKAYWHQMIHLLPTSYNQKRTLLLNYEVLANIYKSRKNHKLDEWRRFCRWIEEELPYSELITGGKNE